MQSDAIAKTIQDAVNGYVMKHPTATVEEISAFTSRVTEHVNHTWRNKRVNPVELRKQRNIRSKIVSDRIKALDVKMGYARVVDYVWQNDVSATGGLAMAYKFDGKTAVVAVAICSDNDNFDYLEGRDIATERFAQGLTLSYEVEKPEDVDQNVVHRDYMNLLSAVKAKQNSQSI